MMMRVFWFGLAFALLPLVGDPAGRAPPASQPTARTRPADATRSQVVRPGGTQALDTRLHELERQVSLLARRVGGPERNLISQSPTGLASGLDQVDRRVDRLGQQLRGLQRRVDRLERRLERLERAR